VQPPTPAINVTLPAFAAFSDASTIRKKYRTFDRTSVQDSYKNTGIYRTAGITVLCAVAGERRRLPSIDISCPRGALSSKPAGYRCYSMGQTDRRTDATAMRYSCTTEVAD